MARTLIVYIIYLVGATVLLMRLVPPQNSPAPAAPTVTPRYALHGMAYVTISVEDGSGRSVTCLTDAERVVADVVQVSTITERDHLLQLLGCGPD